MDIKLVAFDIDGTLIPRGKFEIDPITKKAIKELNENGVATVISTGRIVTFMQEDIINTIKSDYFISINGAVITDGDFNVLKSYPMSEDNFNKVLKAVDKYDVAVGLKYEKEIAVYNQYDHYMEVYTKGNKLPPLIFDYTKTRDYHLTHGMPIGAFLIGDNEKLEKIIEEIDTLEFVHAYDGAVECFAKGNSKAVALKWVADNMHITLDQTMAFGDSDNDIPMLKTAKVGVAMGNATQVTKDNSDYITDSCDNLGIPKALKHFGIIKNFEE